MRINYSLWPVRLLAGLAMVAATAASSQAQTFAPTVTYSGGLYTTAVAVGDLNRDGKPDIVTLSSYSNYLGVLLGNGNGTFQPVRLFSAGGSGYALVLGDVNKDNVLDAVYANSLGDAVGVVLGKGDGTFLESTYYRLSANSTPTGVVLADVSGDGQLDILTANSNGNSASVLLGNGNGTFKPAVQYAAGTGNKPQGVTVADVNADSKPDLLVANYYGASVSVFLGNGDGTFKAVTTFSAGGPAYGITTSDVNADNKLDIITVDNVSRAAVLLGNGDGTFRPVVRYYMGQAPTAVALRDVTGDKKLDIIGIGGGAFVLPGNGDGTFATAVRFPTKSLCLDMAVADLNGDGQPDIVAADYTEQVIDVLLNKTTVLAATPAALPGQVVLFPNPVAAGSGPLGLAISGLPTEARTLRATLLNAVGQVVRVVTVPAVPGARLPVAGLEAGTYLLRLHTLDAQGQVAATLPTQRLTLR